MSLSREARSGSAQYQCVSQAERWAGARPRLRMSWRRRCVLGARYSSLDLQLGRSRQIREGHNESIRHRDNVRKPSGPEVVEYHDRAHDQGGEDIFQTGGKFHKAAFTATGHRTFCSEHRRKLYRHDISLLSRHGRITAWERYVTGSQALLFSASQMLTLIQPSDSAAVPRRWVQHPTETTPFSPEIDYQRFVFCRNVSLFNSLISIVIV